MRIEKIFKKLKVNEDGIFVYQFKVNSQKEELSLRKKVAEKVIKNYLKEISFYHSIPVMDREVKLFLKSIPQNGIILDAGAGWGWHWRNLDKQRKDVRVILVDFVMENLFHAKNLLKDKIGKQIFLVHGDVTQLKFPDECFDGYWSVQCLQHVPEFEKAIKEAYRVLKKEGLFANYSLNVALIEKLIFKLLRKNYVIRGFVKEHFYLERASKRQIELLENIFHNKVKVRFSEILYKPKLFYFTGRENSLLGKIDAYLSGSLKIWGLIARQQSFYVKK